MIYYDILWYIMIYYDILWHLIDVCNTIYGDFVMGDPQSSFTKSEASMTTGCLRGTPGKPPAARAYLPLNRNSRCQVSSVLVLVGFYQLLYLFKWWVHKKHFYFFLQQNHIQAHSDTTSVFEVELTLRYIFLPMVSRRLLSQNVRDFESIPKTISHCQVCKRADPENGSICSLCSHRWVGHTFADPKIHRRMCWLSGSPPWPNIL